jgi:hypothetical protein
VAAGPKRSQGTFTQQPQNTVTIMSSGHQLNTPTSSAMLSTAT